VPKATALLPQHLDISFVLTGRLAELAAGMAMPPTQQQIGLVVYHHGHPHGSSCWIQQAGNRVRLWGAGLDQLRELARTTEGAGLVISRLAFRLSGGGAPPIAAIHLDLSTPAATAHLAQLDELKQLRSMWHRQLLHIGHKRCALCLQPANHRCSRCLVVWYCSSGCQRDDWEEHKPACRALRSVAAGQ